MSIRGGCVALAAETEHSTCPRIRGHSLQVTPAEPTVRRNMVDAWPSGVIRHQSSLGPQALVMIRHVVIRHCKTMGKLSYRTLMVREPSEPIGHHLNEILI